MQLYNTAAFDEDLEELGTIPLLAEQVLLLDAFLDEVAGSSEALWSLYNRHGSHVTPWFNVKAVESCLAHGYNISRIRPLSRNLDRFRILYGIDPQADEFHLLAVAVKTAHEPLIATLPDRFLYNYEPEHPASRRAKVEYDRLGIPILPRR